MPARIIVRIELTANAKARLNGLTEKAGMTQVAMLSRLVEWFANQNDMIQGAVLGQYPLEIQGEIAKLILKHMQQHPEQRLAELAKPKTTFTPHGQRL